MVCVEILLITIFLYYYYFFVESIQRMDRVLVDLDLGLDDAIALFLLLHGQRIGKLHLEAITCVHGNTDVFNVTKNVVRLLEVSGNKNVSIFTILFLSV